MWPDPRQRNSYRNPDPVAGGCNTAIGGQGQSGCMRLVCCRSSSELQISVRTKLKDATTLSYLAWFNRSCLAGTLVGWLVPMVQSQGQNGATDYCPAQDQQQQQQQ